MGDAEASKNLDPTTVGGGAAKRHERLSAERIGPTWPSILRAAAVMAIPTLAFLLCPGCGDGSPESRAGSAVAWIGGLFVVACAVAIVTARVADRKLAEYGRDGEGR